MKVIEVKDLTNEQFFLKYAKPGNVGLVGGTAFIDASIRKIQKSLTKTGTNSLWSHAFIFNGIRQDGHLWLIESDLEFHKKQINVGVQENRVDKYFDKSKYPTLAILDFNLNTNQQNKVIAKGLHLVADRTKYSIRETFGVLLSIIKKSDRSEENVLSQHQSLFCSAMVQECYNAINFKFNETVSIKQLVPEDIINTKLSHICYKLIT